VLELVGQIVGKIPVTIRPNLLTRRPPFASLNPSESPTGPRARGRKGSCH
jgi:hypothetical protein